MPIVISDPNSACPKNFFFLHDVRAGAAIGGQPAAACPGESYPYNPMLAGPANAWPFSRSVLPANIPLGFKSSTPRRFARGYPFPGGRQPRPGPASRVDWRQPSAARTGRQGATTGSSLVTQGSSAAVLSDSRLQSQ